MGVDLISNGGPSEWFSNRNWCKLLQLAEVHGWQPAGTECPDGYPDPGEWYGGYTSCDMQHVSADDAMALSRALVSALPVLSEDDRRPEILPEELREKKISYGLFLQHFIPSHPALWLSGPARTLVRRASVFCGRGEFTIM